MKLIMENWQKFLDEAMKTEPPEGYNVVIFDIDNRGVGIKLRSEEKIVSDRFPKGRYKYAGEMYIERSIPAENGKIIYEVESVYADEGFGPLLYDLAMEMVHFLDGAGLMPDRRSISYDAKNVWYKYFNDRQDIKHEPLPEDLFAGAMSDRKEYLRQYYFKNGTPIIDRLKQDGKLVSSDFNI